MSDLEFQILDFRFRISDSFQMFDFRFRFRISDLSSRVLTLQLKLQLVHIWINLVWFYIWNDTHICIKWILFTYFPNFIKKHLKLLIKHILSTWWLERYCVWNGSTPGPTSVTYCIENNCFDNFSDNPGGPPILYNQYGLEN